MRRFVTVLAVLTFLLIAVAPAGATPGGNGVQGIVVDCTEAGMEEYVVNGVGIPGFPVDDTEVGTAPPIQLFGGTFFFDGATEPAFTDSPPPGLVKTGKLVECRIEASFFGTDVVIDPAWMKFPSA